MQLHLCSMLCILYARLHNRGGNPLTCIHLCIRRPQRGQQACGMFFVSLPPPVVLPLGLQNALVRWGTGGGWGNLVMACLVALWNKRYLAWDPVGDPGDQKGA